MYPEWAYPDAPVFILEVPMARIPSTIGQGPTVTISIPLAADADPYMLSDLGVPPGVDVTVQIIGSGGGGGGPQSPGMGAGAGGGAPAGVIFTVPAAQWALDGLLVLPFGGAGAGVNTTGGAGDDATFTIGSNVVTVAGGTGGSSPGTTGGTGGTVDFSAPDFTLVTARPGPDGKASSGTSGGDGGILSWGGKGGDGADNGGSVGGNATDAKAVLQFTPSSV